VAANFNELDTAYDLKQDIFSNISIAIQFYERKEKQTVEGKNAKLAAIEAASTTVMAQKQSNIAASNDGDTTIKAGLSGKMAGGSLRNLKTKKEEKLEEYQQ
jgi:hypothetical protein